MVVNSLIILSYDALCQAAYAQAYAYQEEAARICVEINAREELAIARTQQALACRRLSWVDEASLHLQEALRLGREIQAAMPIYFALLGAALLYLDQGQVERALELFALGTNHPLIAKARLFEDLAGREVEAAAASLPAEVAEAAQVRGRQRDLFATAAELLQELSDNHFP